MMSNHRHSCAVVVISLGVSLLAACGSEPAAPATGDSTAPATATAVESAAYPPLYRSLALPEVPGGSVTSTGRQSTSLDDGLSIMVDAPGSVEETAVFYRKALADSGWTENRGRQLPAGMPVVAIEATKDKATYRAMITRLPEKTQVTITVIGQ